MQNPIPESLYIQQLLLDLETQLPYVQNRPIQSIFIGGGTPSLFSAKAYSELFLALHQRLSIPTDCEITVEANPGAIEADRFQQYFDIGINRISIGVQSFQNHQLKILGRIHEALQAKTAVRAAHRAGFKKINIDIMFGLPNQLLSDALYDLQTALDLSPTHLSWYQLTIEPNTYFYRFPPILPSDDHRFEIQQTGQNFLHEHSFQQYEISAYSKQDPCRHNLNYWQFGDYLGIGAGAHAKFTILNTMEIIRRNSLKHPAQYLRATTENIALTKTILKKELPLEFMMNALRLYQPIAIALFETRTGLTLSDIEKPLQQAQSEKWLLVKNNVLHITSRGHLFLNNLLELFSE